ncbi:MAG: enoyl-CoA hydratase/isomerase family protein [Thalassovita sp.]
MSHITVEKIGRAGVIGLDRPKALNALDLPMIEDIGAALDKFETDQDIERIVLRSNHGKAFCVGGDLRRILELSAAGHHAEAERFFQTEYALNLRIASYPKPYVSLIDGMCFGGGLGLSRHGQFRIASENAVFAMPETAIGFIPDVGGSYFLPRMPHHAGYWMGLTGGRVKDFSAHALGLSTHMTLASSLENIFDALCFSEGSAQSTFEELCGTLGYQKSVLSLAASTQCFDQPTICSIQDCLETAKSVEAKAAQKSLRSASPRSLQEALTLLRRGAGDSLEGCLAREFDAARRAIHHPDFAEGVRAILIDKDHAPVWPSATAAAPKRVLDRASEPFRSRADL